MTKVIKCDDIFPGCNGEVRARTEEEALQLVAQHARDTHNVSSIDEATLARVRAAIKDD